MKASPGSKNTPDFNETVPFRIAYIGINWRIPLGVKIKKMASWDIAAQNVACCNLMGTTLNLI